MEHIVASKIMNHGEDNSILYPLQHGFRRSISYESQLIEFIDDLTSNIDKGHFLGQQVDILVMDFAKAFDKVCHSLLIHTLQHYGIRGKINSWVESWLANRTQSVVIGGKRSEPVKRGIRHVTRFNARARTISLLHKRPARRHELDRQTLC